MATNDPKKASGEKLSLRRETVKNLSVRSGVKTGLRSGCTDASATYTCGSSPCSQSRISVSVSQA